MVISASGLVGAGWWAISQPAVGPPTPHPGAARVVATAGHPPATPTAVAVSFVRVWLSYDWRFPEASAIGVEPMVTPALLGAWRGRPGAPALDAARQDAHERDVVTSVAATVDDRAPGAVGLVVSAQVMVASDGVTYRSTRDLGVRVVSAGGRWRVGEVEV